MTDSMQVSDADVESLVQRVKNLLLGIFGILYLLLLAKAGWFLYRRYRKQDGLNKNIKDIWHEISFVQNSTQTHLYTYTLRTQFQTISEGVGNYQTWLWWSGSEKEFVSLKAWEEQESSARRRELGITKVFPGEPNKRFYAIVFHSMKKGEKKIIVLEAVVSDRKGTMEPILFYDNVNGYQQKRFSLTVALADAGQKGVTFCDRIMYLKSENPVPGESDEYTHHSKAGKHIWVVTDKKKLGRYRYVVNWGCEE